jgi:hypothetical protein
VGWALPSGLPEYLNSTLLFLGITFIAFFPSTNNFSGPLRYGISKYGPSLHGLYQKSPGGTVWVLVLLRAILPWTQTWLLGIVAMTWQYTLQHFREEVRAAIDTANDVHARAVVATASAKEGLDAALRHEKDAITSSAEATRDVRIADTIKASDFFDAAADAWAAIRTAADSIGRARSYSSQAELACKNISTSGYLQSTVRDAISEATNNTSRASSHAVNADNSVAVAINVITDFEAARNRDSAARQQLRNHESQVKEHTREVLSEAESLRRDVATLQKDAQAVHHKANLAVAKAEEGRMTLAKTLAQEAVNKLSELEEEASRIVGVSDELRKMHVSMILGSD